MSRQLKDDAAEQAITKALDEVNDKIVRGVKEGEGDDEGKHTRIVSCFRQTYRSQPEQLRTAQKGLPWLKISYSQICLVFPFLYKMLAKELNMGYKSCSQIRISLAKFIKF